MKPKVNLLALALESSLLLKNSYVLMVPFMIATLLSFVAYFVMFAGLDPELFNDLNVFFDSSCQCFTHLSCRPATTSPL